MRSVLRLSSQNHTIQRLVPVVSQLEPRLVFLKFEAARDNLIRYAYPYLRSIFSYSTPVSPLPNQNGAHELFADWLKSKHSPKAIANGRFIMKNTILSTA